MSLLPNLERADGLVKLFTDMSVFEGSIASGLHQPNDTMTRHRETLADRCLPDRTRCQYQSFVIQSTHQYIHAAIFLAKHILSYR
jgi:hypothetical protein